VVLPASTCAAMPMLRTWVRSGALDIEVLVGLDQQ
jgi:hypothetical protein